MNVNRKFRGANSGLARLEGDRFVAAGEGPLAIDTYSIYEDREGCLWAGIAGGLNRVAQSQFPAYTKRDGLSHNLVPATSQSRALLVDRASHIWAGSEGGLYEWDGSRSQRRSVEHGLAHPVVRCLTEHAACSAITSIRFSKTTTPISG